MSRTRKSVKRCLRLAVSLVVLSGVSVAQTPDRSAPPGDAPRAEDSPVIAPGARLEKISDEYRFTEGPAADARGNVYFTDQPNDRIVRWNAADGTLEDWLKPSGRANGTFFDASGNLVACADEKNELWSIAPDRKVTVLLKDLEGKLLNGPNDLWIRPDGGIYFTDPLYRRDYWSRSPDMQQDGQHVYYLARGATAPVRVAADLRQPNGIIGTPDGGTLYVADIGARKTFAYAIQPDGSLEDKRLFCELGSDGMTIDTKGNVYLTGRGVTVFDRTGAQIEQIAVPERWTANVTFGGEDNDILFITASRAVYRIRMRVKGAGRVTGRAALPPPRRMEALGRGLVAVKRNEGSVYVGWRLLGTDPESIAFNLYRITDGGAPLMVNESPIVDSTNHVDRGADLASSLEYSVRPVVDGRELAASKPARAWDAEYLEIPIQSIERYRPGDASIGDLDGDGEYEIVLHQASRGRDNSHAGVTGAPILDAYEMDGTHLWRIHLGFNIREGEHYTQFMVYDLDGDGRAEVACKTADGTKDGQGATIGDAEKDWRILEEGSRLDGRILAGPEYFTIFDGRTGAALKTVDYIPPRYPIDGWGGIGGNGGNDNYGNRCDRFLACVAYLDGTLPSVVMCRGVYGRIVMAAWDWREGDLSVRWVFDSGMSYPPFENASPYSGMGGHSLSVADVDGDGRDEIVYQAMVVDDDGRGLYSTGLRHGDSMHISDMDVDRPGLEVFTVQENEGYTVRFETPGVAFRDARTGEILWSHSPGTDVGSGLAADIDPRHRGYESWGGPGGLRNARGEEIGPRPRSTGWAIWWDGDPLRELLDRSRVTKWSWERGAEETIYTIDARGGGRGPNLLGDFIGDWREELLMTAPSGDALRLYTTTIPTEHRIHTLMHDPQYRLSIAWQNVVYNKPPHPGYFLGDGMAPPPRPRIAVVREGDGDGNGEGQSRKE